MVILLVNSIEMLKICTYDLQIWYLTTQCISIVHHTKLPHRSWMWSPNQHCKCLWNTTLFVRCICIQHIRSSPSVAEHFNMMCEPVFCCFVKIFPCMICFYIAKKLDIVTLPKLGCAGNWCKPSTAKAESLLIIICLAILMFWFFDKAYYATCSNCSNCLPHGITALNLQVKKIPVMGYVTTLPLCNSAVVTAKMKFYRKVINHL